MKKLSIKVFCSFKFIIDYANVCFFYYINDPHWFVWFLLYYLLHLFRSDRFAARFRNCLDHFGNCFTKKLSIWKHKYSKNFLLGAPVGSMYVPVCPKLRMCHCSAFIDFLNIFIRYRSKQSTSELSLMATDMVSTTFFPIRKLLLQNENINQFGIFLFKTFALHFLFKFNMGFFSCSTLTCFVNMA